MKQILPLIVCALFFSKSSKAQAVAPFTTCPGVNVAIARAGDNSATTNPYYLYTVNTSTGGLTLVPGAGFKDPANGSNLQVNAIGVNRKDGFMYGLTTDPTVSTSRFVRLDKNYGVTNFGNIASPSSPAITVGIINSAAGDVDVSDNFYFTAFTANPTTSTAYTLDKLFLGKISGISTLSGTPAPQYFEIDYSDANCSGYISTLSSDPNNSGIKDITFNPVTNSFFIYATYKPTGAANFSAQLLELKPVAGSSPLKYKLFCNPVVNAHNAETAGSLMDNAGNFLVLLTDGTIGKLQSSGSAFNYTGGYTALNNTTGLPSPLRGDMASCGAAAAGPLALSLSSFKATTKDCKTNFSWTAENEINFSHYELEQSFDGITFTSDGSINARNSSVSSAYSFTVSSAGRLSYYRLKMMDNDGRISYSNILPVNNSCNNFQHGFVINPNPVKSVINLNWYGLSSSTNMKVNIYNAYGMLVSSTYKSLPAGSSVLNINAGTLPSGIYFIKAIDEKSNEILQQKFVKQ